ncbi:hypothetical protein DIPPA_08196 [Diplonema papillatum]|nr:hypothetical protein DIPPA_08196 [Diplonema papillatum]
MIGDAGDRWPDCERANCKNSKWRRLRNPVISGRESGGRYGRRWPGFVNGEIDYLLGRDLNPTAAHHSMGLLPKQAYVSKPRSPSPVNMKLMQCRTPLEPRPDKRVDVLCPLHHLTEPRAVTYSFSPVGLAPKPDDTRDTSSAPLPLQPGVAGPNSSTPPPAGPRGLKPNDSPKKSPDLTPIASMNQALKTVPPGIPFSLSTGRDAAPYFQTRPATQAPRKAAARCDFQRKPASRAVDAKPQPGEALDLPDFGPPGRSAGQLQDYANQLKGIGTIADYYNVVRQWDGGAGRPDDGSARGKKQEPGQGKGHYYGGDSRTAALEKLGWRDTAAGDKEERLRRQKLKGFDFSLATDRTKPGFFTAAAAPAPAGPLALPPTKGAAAGYAAGASPPAGGHRPRSPVKSSSVDPLVTRSEAPPGQRSVKKQPGLLVEPLGRQAGRVDVVKDTRLDVVHILTNYQKAVRQRGRGAPAAAAGQADEPREEVSMRDEFSLNPSTLTINVFSCERAPAVDLGVLTGRGSIRLGTSEQRRKLRKQITAETLSLDQVSISPELLPPWSP